MGRIWPSDWFDAQEQKLKPALIDFNGTWKYFGRSVLIGDAAAGLVIFTQTYTVSYG